MPRALYPKCLKALSLTGLAKKVEDRISMPIFEYRCKKCEEEFEALVLGRESAECPSCHGTKLEKLLSTFAAFTGSGGSRMEASSQPGACGSCGDPRGPGACSMN